MKEYPVYRLVDPRDLAVFYVGITNNPEARLKQHLACDGSNPDKDARIQEIGQQGLQPLMEGIERPGTLHLARLREAHWIDYYLQEQALLTNIIIPSLDGKGIRGKRVAKAIRKVFSIHRRDYEKYAYITIALEKNDPIYQVLLQESREYGIS